MIFLLPRPLQSCPLVRRMVDEHWQGTQPRLLETILKLEGPGCPGFSPSIGGEYFEHSRSVCRHGHHHYHCISVQDERGSRWSRRKPNAPSARGGGNGGQIFFANIIFIIIITGIIHVITITLITATTKKNPFFCRHDDHHHLQMKSSLNHLPHIADSATLLQLCKPFIANT